MLSSTDPLSIRGKFSIGCYSFMGPDRPVCLAVRGGPVPMDPTGDGGQETLLGENFFRLTKNPGLFLMLYSPLIGLHWKLGICCQLRHW